MKCGHGTNAHNMIATESKCRAKIAVANMSKPVYPRDAPYHPSSAYPEYPFKGHISSCENEIYAGVRRLLHLLGLDAENYGTEQWNPLGHLIEPGMTVVIKPNFVLGKHSEGKDVFSIITHPSVLRAIADYSWIALKGRGEIVVADAPQYDCDFKQLVEITKIDHVCDFYSDFSGPKVHLYDLRSYWSKTRHFPSCKIPLPGDPKGVTTVRLGRQSALYNCPNPERFYGTVYHRSELINHHCGETQEYEISRTVLDADVVISVPKLKVHKKVGVTLNLKGLVGICTNKNFCLHYRLGSPGEGGDQYPEGLFSPVERSLIRLERWMYDNLLARRSVVLEYIHRSAYWLHGLFIKPFGITVPREKRMLDAGNWHGNDSAWRMVFDLLKVFYFADGQGCMHTDKQRRVFSVIDGVIGGQNNGPLSPEPKPAGVLLAGENIVAVDLVATRLMGFDPLKLRLYRNVLEDLDFDYGIREPGDIEVICDEGGWQNCVSDGEDRFFDFKPHPGWVGHIEI